MFSCVEVFFGELDDFVAFGGGIDPINRGLGLKGLAGITVEFGFASDGGEKFAKWGWWGGRFKSPGSSKPSGAAEA